MSLVLFACLATPNKLRTLIFIKTVKLGINEGIDSVSKLEKDTQLSKDLIAFLV